MIIKVESSRVKSGQSSQKPLLADAICQVRAGVQRLVFSQEEPLETSGTVNLLQPEKPLYRRENPGRSLGAGVHGVCPGSESLSPLDNNVT